MSFGSLQPALATAAGGLFAVGSVLLVTLLLSAKGGRLTAGLFLAGYWGGYGLLGILGLLLDERLTGVSWTQPVFGALMLIFCALFFLLAFRNLRAVIKGQGAEPIKILSSMDRLSPPKALGVGALITVINFKNLAIYLTAIGALSALPPAQRWAALPLIVLIFCCMTLLPMMLSLLFRRRSESWIRKLRQGLEAHGRKISIPLLTVFGFLFLVRGVKALFLQP